MESDTLNIDNVLDTVRRQLGREYHFIERLGGGEFSNVYRVRHVQTEQEHALKVMDYHYLLQKLRKTDVADSDSKYNEIKKRFIAEARLYKQITHPNIVTIHDSGVIEDKAKGLEIPYIIMQYIRGRSLANVIKTDAPLSTERIREIADDVLDALDTIHRQKVIHRDLKPANIMVEEHTGRAVIIDFGIAKEIVDTTRLTSTGALLGSPVYMAPEQFADSSSVGPAIDIYSFGVVLYEMLTGHTPFTGNHFVEIMHAHREKPLPDVRLKNPHIHPAFPAILEKSMAKDPNQRYRSPREFLAALNDSPTSERGPLRLRRGNYKYLLAAGVILTLALLLYIFFPRLSEPEIPKEMTPEAMTSAQRALEDGAAPSVLKPAAPDAAKTAEAKAENPAQVDSDPEKEFSALLAQTEKLLKKSEFDLAADKLEKARSIRESNETRSLEQAIRSGREAYRGEHGDDVFEPTRRSGKVELAGYLQFLRDYPKSRHLPELKKLLLASDPNLPPEPAWRQPLQRNSRGYYEQSFPAGGQPHVMIYIPGKNIWMDKYEVSNRQFRHGAPGDAAEADFPAVVTYSEALEYCRKCGFRLPRQEEWEYVAGKGRNTFPWGEEAPDEGGVFRANYDTLGEKEEKDGFERNAPVNSFQAFASPFGGVNMAGNAWEWVQGRILKGGGFLSGVEDIKIKNSRGGRDNDKVGFRCVRDDSGGMQ